VYLLNLIMSFIIHFDDILVAQAVGDSRFNDGLSSDDYYIVMEAAQCIIESFTANEIDCRPPIWAPARNPQFRLNRRFTRSAEERRPTTTTLDCHRHGQLNMQVWPNFMFMAYGVYLFSGTKIVLVKTQRLSLK